MGSEHLQIWKDMLLTYVLVSVLLVTFVFLLPLPRKSFFRNMAAKHLGAESYNPQYLDRQPHQALWVPLRETFRLGLIQRGARAE